MANGAQVNAPLARQPVTYVVTDLEGRRDAIDDLIEAGRLTWGPEGLGFVHAGDRLLVAGDIADRGPHAIRIVDALLALRRRCPGRVDWTFGNLDLKSLALLRDWPALALATPGYADWLRAQAAAEAPTTCAGAHYAAAADTVAQRLRYWLARQGAAGAFEHHRHELSVLRGEPCAPDSAALDYLRRLQPGGSMFEYLRQGSVALVRGNVLIDHGGVAATNIGFLPGATQRCRDAREWIAELNRWAAEEIAAIETAVATRGLGAHIPDALMRYADAIWDPTAASGNGALFMNDVSIIYPFRRKEQGNLRAPDAASIAYLRQCGIDTEIVGHTPFGDLPGPLRAEGFLRLMADTSRRAAGARSTIAIDEQGHLRVRGKTARGVPVCYRVSAGSPQTIGFVTADEGFTVVGRGRVDGGTRFLLTKYYGGFHVRDLVVDRARLAALRPQPAAARTPLDEPRRHFELLIDELRRRGKRILAIEELDECLGARVPVVVSGFSKYGHSPLPEADVDTEAEALVAGLGPPAGCLLVTGGTDNGFERAVHRAARAAGHAVVGFIQQGAIAGEIGLVDSVVFSGAHQDWSAPLLAALGFAARHGGVAVFVGGGSVVSDGIGYARELGMRYVLLDRAPQVAGSGGASARAAAALPDGERAPHVVATLRHLGGLFVDARLGRKRQPGGKSAASAAARLRIGVFVGSFDPPHAGHRDLVGLMARQYALDRVYAVPDPVTQYKQLQPLVHRLRMTELLFQEDQAVRVLDASAADFGSGEMHDVLLAVRRMHPDAELFNIVGSDTLRWYAALPVAQRVPGVRLLVNDRADAPDLPREVDGECVHIVQGHDRGFSSTRIREALRLGHAAPGLTAQVRAYAMAHQLYGAESASPTAPEARTVRAPRCGDRATDRTTE